MTPVLHAIFRVAYAAQYQAQVGHWHVQGEDFHEFHAMFKDEYEYWQGKIDDIAEHIRTAGEFLPTSLADLGAHAAKFERSSDSKVLCANYLRHLKALLGLAQKLNREKDANEADVDLAGELSRDMRKAIWKFENVLSPQAK